MAVKYNPLEEYLRKLPSTQKEVTLSFAQIEGRWKGTSSVLRTSSPKGEDSLWSFLSEGDVASLRLVVQQAPPRSGRLGGVGFDFGSYRFEHLFSYTTMPKDGQQR
jgi:hypothetical protein